MASNDTNPAPTRWYLDGSKMGGLLAGVALTFVFGAFGGMLFGGGGLSDNGGVPEQVYTAF